VSAKPRPLVENRHLLLDLDEAGVLPVCPSEDLRDPLPHVRSVLGMLHGRLRNPAVYYRTAMEAVAQRPGWLVVAPQFLVEVDHGGGAVADPRQYHTIATFNLFPESG
jgi:hypothetical protein